MWRFSTSFNIMYRPRWTIIFYTTYISVYLAHPEICRAEGGKGAIMIYSGLKWFIMFEPCKFLNLHVLHLVRTGLVNSDCGGLLL